eukprot:224312_1
MAGSESSFVLGSVFYLIFSALVFPYSAYCLYRFISTAKTNSNDGYFKRRHPIANVIFLLCFFVATFIIYPFLVILAMIDYEESSILNAIGISDDLTSVILFALIICRVWFLYSEYALHYNMSSWIWKREINPQQSNCIIKYRQIFGNAKCCTLLIFVALFVPIILILDVVPSLFLADPSTKIFFEVAIVVVFIGFTLFILLSQLKRVLDVYNIRRELVYEIAVFGSLLLFTDVVSNALLLTNKIGQTQQILFSSILSTVTGIFVIYIGTNWVLTTFTQYKLITSLGDHGTETNDQRINSHDLIQILNTKQGVECFLLHMVHELQLEKMLFLIEILQFKQEIKTRLQQSTWKVTNDPQSKDSLKIKYMMHDELSLSFDDANTNQMDVSMLFQIDLKALEIPNDPRLKQWNIYQFAVHLYDKYIEEGASLQLSISYDCERKIYAFFRSQNMTNEAGTEHTTVTTKDDEDEDGSDSSSDEVKDEEEAVLVSEDEDDGHVVAKHRTGKGYDALGRESIVQDMQDDAMERMVGIEGVHGEENIKIIYDLFRLYDSALAQVWSAISNEIFNRFKKTSEYAVITENINNVGCIDPTNRMHLTAKKRGVASNSITMD